VIITLYEHIILHYLWSFFHVKNVKSSPVQGCYIGDHGLTAVGQCCKQLEDLNLRFCEGLTDSGVVDFAQLCGKSLKSLGIAACAWITDRSLIAVASHSTRLETLSLDSEFFRNEGIMSVAKSCPSLKALKLQCINVTDEALQVVGSLCSSLELLALHSFQRFTDRYSRVPVQSWYLNISTKV